MVRFEIHSKPVPLWLADSLALSVRTRRWAQFRVRVVAWGRAPRNKPLAIKNHPGRYNAIFLKNRSFALFLGTPNGQVPASVWSVNLEPSTQWQTHKRPEVEIWSCSSRPAQVARSPPTTDWPAVTATVRQQKVLETQTCTSWDTSRQGRCDGFF